MNTNPPTRAVADRAFLAALDQAAADRRPVVPATDRPRVVAVRSQRSHDVRTPNPAASSQPTVPTSAGPAFVLSYDVHRTWAHTPDGRVLAWADGHDSGTVGAVASVAAAKLASWYR